MPFAVVSDWIQQGRLLEGDMVKPSGTKEWQRIGGSADFAPYLPGTQPPGVEDKAEALEPVEVGFSWKARPQEDDDEVDMIPLIDVTLVLLIFFMMTAVVGRGPQIDLPPAASGGVVDNYKEAGIAIDLIGKGQTKENALHAQHGQCRLHRSGRPEHSDARRGAGPLKVLLDHNDRPVELVINAHEDVKASLLLQLTVALEKPPLKERLREIYRGVKGRR